MKKFFYILILFLVLANYYLNDIKNPETPEIYIYWSNLNFWLHSLPLLYYFFQGYKYETFPFVGILGLLLMFSYSIPPFFIRPSSYQLGTLSVESMEVSFWSYFVFYLSFFTFRKLNFLKGTTFDPIKLSNSDIRIRYLALVCLSIYLTDKFLISGTFFHYIGIATIYIYLGTYIVLFNSSIRVNLFEKSLFIVIFVSEYINRLFDGLLVLIAFLTLYWILIDFYSSRKTYRIVFIALPCLLALSVISPIKSEFREIVWFSDRSYGAVERLEILSALYDNNTLDNNSVNNMKSAEQMDREHFTWRYSYQASALSLALKETPEIVPFWNGESYVLFSKLIPRIFWEDKPKEDMGYKFGTRYRIIDKSNTNTSMNTPILTEMYINFGYIGIFIGMILLGLLYVCLNQYFNNVNTSIFGKVYSIAIVFPFVVHESNFSLVFGNLFWLCLALLSMIKILTRGK